MTTRSRPTLKPTLKPTLWRTCRVLASPVRLRMLEVLFRNRNLSVSSVAGKLGVPLGVASQYLRALGARGLIASRRQGRTVAYRPAADPSVYGTTELLRALRHALKPGPRTIDTAFRHATAFTHPRRIVIVHALASGPLAAGALARQTGISRGALCRHLNKLLRRGFVTEKDGLWRLVRPREPFAATLVRLACER